MAIRQPDRQLQLIAIARRLFAERGYDGTSLRDIATEAGVTKAALYHHFPNKSELYRKIAVDGMRDLYEAARGAVLAHESPLAKLRAFMRASAEYFEANRDQWLANSSAFWHTHDPGPRSATVEYRDAYEHLLRKCIDDGIAQGEVEPCVNAALAAKLLLSGITHLARWYTPAGSMTAAQIIDEFVNMTLAGIERKAARPAAAKVGRRSSNQTSSSLTA